MEEFESTTAEALNNTVCEPNKTEETVKIKHLVISGGGAYGFSAYAAIRESNRAKLWNIDDIETIYGTSAGSIISVMLALRYDWDTMDDFLLKRPWGSVFQIIPDIVLSVYSNRGLFDKTHMENVFSPLFGGKDIPLDITLQGFYEKTGIEIHIFVTEVNGDFSSETDLSYLTHPEWLLLDAVYCSCCIPGFFQPFIKDEKCYIDGGVFMNYPMFPCLKRINSGEEKTILGIKRQETQQGVSQKINTKTTLLEMVMILAEKIMQRALMDESPQNIREICVEANSFSITGLLLSLNSEKERIRLFETGVQSWEKHQTEWAGN